MTTIEKVNALKASIDDIVNKMSIIKDSINHIIKRIYGDTEKGLITNIIARHDFADMAIWYQDTGIDYNNRMTDPDNYTSNYSVTIFYRHDGNMDMSISASTEYEYARNIVERLIGEDPSYTVSIDLLYNKLESVMNYSDEELKLWIKLS